MQKYQNETMTPEELVSYVNEVLFFEENKRSLWEAIYDFSTMDKENGKEAREYFDNEIDVVEADGGHEGGGEYVCYTYFFKKACAYLKIEGEYYSYSGTEFHNPFFLAEPEIKTITVYNRKD